MQYERKHCKEMQCCHLAIRAVLASYYVTADNFAAPFKTSFFPADALTPGLYLPFNMVTLLLLLLLQSDCWW